MRALSRMWSLPWASQWASGRVCRSELTSQSSPKPMVHRARAAAPTFSGTLGSTSTKASCMTLPPAASLHHGAESFYQHWQRLNDWLAEHRELWQPTPFTDPRPAWIRKWPALAEQVANLPD